MGTKTMDNYHQEPLDNLIEYAMMCAETAHVNNLDKKEEWLASWMGVDSVFDDAWYAFCGMFEWDMTDDEEEYLTMIISDKIYHLYRGEKYNIPKINL